MPDDFAFPPKTSMPLWQATPAALDSAAAEYTIYSIDSNDGATARRWAGELAAASVEHQVVDIDGSELKRWLTTCFEEFDRLATAKRVGWRVAASGDEAGVLAVLAAGRHIGLIDSEITIYAETHRRRRVYCAYCKAVTLTQTDQQPICSGCHEELAVKPHFSRDTGCYLGVRGPAEVTG
jgi:hypothetical protein